MYLTVSHIDALTTYTCIYLSRSLSLSIYIYIYIYIYVYMRMYKLASCAHLYTCRQAAL